MDRLSRKGRGRCYMINIEGGFCLGGEERRGLDGSRIRVVVKVW